jgi:hypothetical protein
MVNDKREVPYQTYHSKILFDKNFARKFEHTLQQVDDKGKKMTTPTIKPEDYVKFKHVS